MTRTQQWPDYLETSSAEQRIVPDCSGDPPDSTFDNH